MTCRLSHTSWRVMQFLLPGFRREPVLFGGAPIIIIQDSTRMCCTHCVDTTMKISFKSLFQDGGVCVALELTNYLGLCESMLCVRMPTCQEWSYGVEPRIQELCPVQLEYITWYYLIGTKKKEYRTYKGLHAPSATSRN